MTGFTSVESPAVRRSRIGFWVLLGGLLIISPSLSAQTPPPIDGVTGTVAPGASVQADQAIHAVIVKTADGVGHLFHYAKALFVHGKKGGDAEQPDAPRESTKPATPDPAGGAQTANRADVRAAR